MANEWMMDPSAQPKNHSESYYNKIIGMGTFRVMHSPAPSVTDLPGLFVDPDWVSIITIFMKLKVKFNFYHFLLLVSGSQMWRIYHFPNELSMGNKSTGVFTFSIFLCAVLICRAHQTLCYLQPDCSIADFLFWQHFSSMVKHSFCLLASSRQGELS